MCVLVDWQIQEIASHGAITPFDAGALQPASYDVKLGSAIRRFDDLYHYYTTDPVDPFNQEQIDGLMHEEVYQYDNDYIVIKSYEFFLAHTFEKVDVPVDLVCRLEGKSSIGRLGLAVHITAGYIDPGFKGVITLEMVNFSPSSIILKPGMPIAQIGFLQLSGYPHKGYQGRYQGDTTVTSSRYGVRRTT